MFTVILHDSDIIISGDTKQRVTVTVHNTVSLQLLSLCLDIIILPEYHYHYHTHCPGSLLVSPEINYSLIKGKEAVTLAFNFTARF